MFYCFIFIFWSEKNNLGHPEYSIRTKHKLANCVDEMLFEWTLPQAIDCETTSPERPPYNETSTYLQERLPLLLHNP